MGWGMLGYFAPPGCAERETARSAHRYLMFAAVFAALAGLAAIVANKVFVLGKSPLPHSVHAYAGFATLALTLGQGLVGRTRRRGVNCCTGQAARTGGAWRCRRAGDE